MRTGQDDSADGAVTAAANATVKSRLTLPRRKRLSKAGFRSTFDNNKSLASRDIVMWLRQTPGETGEVGFIATKKMFARAVDRNRAKRLLRETYRLTQHSIDPEVDIILLARRPILSSRFDKIGRGFTKLCRKAKIWREEL